MDLNAQDDHACGLVRGVTTAAGGPLLIWTIDRPVHFLSGSADIKLSIEMKEIFDDIDVGAFAVRCDSAGPWYAEAPSPSWAEGRPPWRRRLSLRRSRSPHQQRLPPKSAKRFERLAFRTRKSCEIFLMARGFWVALLDYPKPPPPSGGLRPAGISGNRWIVGSVISF